MRASGVSISHRPDDATVLRERQAAHPRKSLGPLASSVASDGYRSFSHTVTLHERARENPTVRINDQAQLPILMEESDTITARIIVDASLPDGCEPTSAYRLEHARGIESEIRGDQSRLEGGMSVGQVDLAHWGVSPCHLPDSSCHPGERGQYALMPSSGE